MARTNERPQERTRERTHQHRQNPPADEHSDDHSEIDPTYHREDDEEESEPHRPYRRLHGSGYNSDGYNEESHPSPPPESRATTQPPSTGHRLS